ncbi:MAG: hypothetical protein H6Q73_3803 [Firmicutes bacterium]|nr:hypothetical protein [Bacillota bacterium]
MMDIFSEQKRPCKDRFIELLESTNRDGIKELIQYLNGTDFFTAPASTKYHGAKEGGLVEHSLAVYDNLEIVLNVFSFEGYIQDTLVITALLHDICKASFYTIEMRNKKDYTTNDGIFHPGWGSYPFYAIDDQYPYGHGEKSVDIIRNFIELTVEEKMAIRWHMGAFGAESYADRQTLSAAMEKFNLILALQMADMAASYFDKK